MMGGWKTWTGAIGSILVGIWEITEGEVEAGIGHITLGAGMIGIGHKVEKNKP